MRSCQRQQQQPLQQPLRITHIKTTTHWTEKHNKIVVDLIKFYKFVLDCYTVTECFGEIDKLYTPCRCLPSVFHLVRLWWVQKLHHTTCRKTCTKSIKNILYITITRNSRPLQHALGILQLPRKSNPHLHIVEFDVLFAQKSTKNPKCMIDGEYNISMMADYT